MDYRKVIGDEGSVGIDCFDDFCGQWRAVQKCYHEEEPRRINRHATLNPKP